MIDNVVMLITGALKQRDVAELLPRCHPLGAFDQMAAVGIARTPTELYTAILVDTPLGRFIKLRVSPPETENFSIVTEAISVRIFANRDK